MHGDQVRFIPEIQGLFNICKSTNITHHLNKKINHIIIPTDREKSFDKVKHSS